MNIRSETAGTPARVLVWDLPVRVFHWSLALSFAVAYLTAEGDQSRTVHLVSGYLFVALIAFRLVWGVVGSRYARFAEFLRSPATTLAYLRSQLAGRPQHYLGHNPLGAVAIILMLGLGIAIGTTGWMNVASPSGEAYEEIHEALATAMLALVVLHILGVAISSRMHGENLAKAMVTGTKTGAAEASIPRRHGAVALLLVLALAAFGWGLAQGYFPALLDPAAIAAAPDNDHGEAAESADD